MMMTMMMSQKASASHSDLPVLIAVPDALNGAVASARAANVANTDVLLWSAVSELLLVITWVLAPDTTAPNNKQNRQNMCDKHSLSLQVSNLISLFI